MKNIYSIVIIINFVSSIQLFFLIFKLNYCLHNFFCAATWVTCAQRFL